VVYTAKQTGPSRGRVLNGSNNNWFVGGMEVKSSLFWGWVSQKTEIPADNNAYVYWNRNGQSRIFENGILNFQNGGMAVQMDKN
jgi:hypothetical protein